MTQTGSAKVQWNPEKEALAGGDPGGRGGIRRQCSKTLQDAADPEPRNFAVQTARDEGYTLDEAKVSIAH